VFTFLEILFNVQKKAFNFLIKVFNPKLISFNIFKVSLDIQDIQFNNQRDFNCFVQKYTILVGGYLLKASLCDLSSKFRSNQSFGLSKTRFIVIPAQAGIQ
jgi:hypothetical protein